MTARPARAHPRTVLLAALLLIVLAGGLYALAPWALPVRIREGPLVQQATQTGATLIWYTTRPLSRGACEVTASIGPEQRTWPAAGDGERQRVQLDGLAAGQAYPYRIRLGRRTLAEGTLHTNKPAGQPFSFIVFGDSGRGSQAQYLLADRMRAPEFAPDFILHAGDLIYGSGQRAHYQDRFFVPYRPLLADVSFWPCLGNHDVQTDGGGPYFEVFELPENGPASVPAERNYWFDYASARIAVIDSNADETTLGQHVAPWLREVLGGSAPGWKFVALHHPPYTAGSYKPDTRIQQALVPVFEQVGVDIVFCGHDHMYERTYPLREGSVAADGRGVTYIVTGAGGAQLYEALPPAKRPAYIAVLHNEEHSFTYVQVAGDQLSLRQVGVNGRVLDTWSLSKSAPASQSPAPASQPP